MLKIGYSSDTPENFPFKYRLVCCFLTIPSHIKNNHSTFLTEKVLKDNNQSKIRVKFRGNVLSKRDMYQNNCFYTDQNQF